MNLVLVVKTVSHAQERAVTPATKSDNVVFPIRAWKMSKRQDVSRMRSLRT
jgi:hypothetical protein